MTYEERLQCLREKMRAAIVQAERADEKWNRINRTLDERIAATDAMRRRSKRPPLDLLAKVQLKNDNLELADAYGVQGWWRTQAQYYANALLAEIAAHEALGEMR